MSIGIKQILTIGSCLSANIAIQMSEMNCLLARISSVQHNRIDQFLSVYLHNEYPKLQKSDLGFDLLPQYKAVNIIDNQIRGVGLGKSLPNSKDQLPLIDPLLAIGSGKLKICIFDDYAEIFFKIYKHNTKGTPLFINEKYMDSKVDSFTFQNELLSPEKALHSYKETCLYIGKKNKDVCFIFVPFPINMKNSPLINKRADDFNQIYNYLSQQIPNCYIFEREAISINDLCKSSDIFHFNDKRYSRYAENIINALELQLF